MNLLDWLRFAIAPPNAYMGSRWTPRRFHASKIFQSRDLLPAPEYPYGLHSGSKESPCVNFTQPLKSRDPSPSLPPAPFALRPSPFLLPLRPSPEYPILSCKINLPPNEGEKFWKSIHFLFLFFEFHWKNLFIFLIISIFSFGLSSSALILLKN